MKHVAKLCIVILIISATAVFATTSTDIANLPATSVVLDTDSVVVVKNAQAMKAAAGKVRNMTASHITDLTVAGLSILTTPTPSTPDTYFIRINPDFSVSYLNQAAFLSAIGAQPASITIQTLDGSVVIPGFSVLQVPNGTLTDLGGGIAQITYGTGTGGGGTWGSITGNLPDQLDLAAALAGKQPINSSLTSLSGATIGAFGLTTLSQATAASFRIAAGLDIGNNVQAWNTNLDDLADGSLTGSKVGPGISASNITVGTLATARGGLGADVSGYSTGLYGTIGGVPTNVNTFALLRSATGITGTPDGTKFLKDDGTLAVPPGGSLQFKELDGVPTVNGVTVVNLPNSTLTDNGGGVITLTFAGGGGGDTTSIETVSLDNQIVLFNSTTGKQIKKFTGTGLLQSTAGVLSTVTSAQMQTLVPGTGTGNPVYANSPTLVAPSLGNASGTSFTAPFFQSSNADPADIGVIRLGYGELIAWETSPAAGDVTFGYTAASVFTASAPINAPSLTEGGLAVPNSSDNISFFSQVTSAGFISKLSDPVGLGRVVFDQGPTLTSPILAGTQTWSGNYLFSDTAMPALAINTALLGNTFSSNLDTTFTFSATPAVGAFFGVTVTNTDAANSHVYTLPANVVSDGLLGAVRANFTVAKSGRFYMKFRYDGGGNYTVWGDPLSINDLSEDTTPTVATDFVESYKAGVGHVKVKMANLPTGSGDQVLVNGSAATDANFADAVAGITWTITGASPSVIKGFIGLDAVALGANTTGPYVASVANGLGMTGGAAGSEGAALTIGFDESGVASGDYPLAANQLQFVQNGLVAEGSSADTIEQFLVFANPTGSDKTHTLADRSGTISQSGDTFIGAFTATLDPSGITTAILAANSVNGTHIALGSDAIGDLMYYDGTDWARRTTGTAGFLLQTNGAAAPTWINLDTQTRTFTNKDVSGASNKQRVQWGVAVSDETTTLTVVNSKITFRMPYGMTLTSVRGSLTQAQSSGSVFTFDVRMNGTTIFSTKPSFDNSSKTTVGAATPAVISTSALTDDAEMTVDITQVGGGTPTGLKVTLIGTNP